MERLNTFREDCSLDCLITVLSPATETALMTSARVVLNTEGFDKNFDFAPRYVRDNEDTCRRRTDSLFKSNEFDIALGERKGKTYKERRFPCGKYGCD